MTDFARTVSLDLGLPPTMSQTFGERVVTRSALHALLFLLLPLFLLGILARHAEHAELAILDIEKTFLWSLHTQAAPWLYRIALAVSMLVTVSSLCILAALLYRRLWHTALFWLASIGGSAILSSLLKNVVRRIRPELWTTLTSHATFSFPSGHATQSMAIALTLVVLFRSSRRIGEIVAAGAAAVLLVGLCRMYLGHHFPTDILAGWMLSLAWVAMLVRMFDDRYLTLT